ncbi:hypothetical protein MMC20_000970, partial [Loxospora ochrophaea]|nr:hypothetical protein [Loxospora ochrophaea]
MIISKREQELCRFLRDLPARYSCHYSQKATQTLHEALFRSLVRHNESYLKTLFKDRIPKEDGPWSLRKAQGATEGAEYTEAARGKACGHIFKSGEATYRCKTCTLDDTCVLCTRCFESSDHTGHMVYVNITPGNSGCCDCGDAEAWRLPVNCAIHTAERSNVAGKRREAQRPPADLVESIKMTIGRAFDYICDVISCSPEQLRLPKTEDSIKKDEAVSRLASKWYEEGDEIEPNPEFALILWNDEKHTIDEVQNQVARACKAAMSFGLKKANETNDFGRSVVTYARDLRKLLKIAKIIEDIKITVTIRSSRDTFREQMCGAVIEWLGDISGCSVGEDHDILKQTICEEMLKMWRTGSEASNASVGKCGIDDHELDEAAEWSDFNFTRLPHQNAIHLPQLEDDSEDESNGNDNEDGDDEADSQINEGENEDSMDLDVDTVTPTPDGDLEMRPVGEPEDDLEVSEATYAGYPPPPPPPPPLRPDPTVWQHNRSIPQNSEPLTSSRTSSKANMEVPQTPHSHARKHSHTLPPSYWIEQPPGSTRTAPLPLYEDLRQRVRLDWMILYDLRLWKKARIDLRDLYISTVVTIPQFKRVLGLRFSGLYTVLAQLYLIADREPDHSIINLSLQMLTTPSITEEIVERGNFLTNLIAILYTFLTTRQVGHPWEVSINATLAFDTGSVTNRRMYHFFMDLKHLFASPYVQDKLRKHERYVLQFLDLIRLPQGICPNVRAVGDHVEYETDAWISASLLTREVNRLCRQFAESFRWRQGADMSNNSKVIRATAKATIVNSIGAERARFDQSETKHETRFKTLNGFDFDRDELGRTVQYSVVDFVVEREPISFHHALHYTLSWLIDGGKSLSADQLRGLLHFQVTDLRESPPYKSPVPELAPDRYLIALFDYPLRVCAWLAQMKAGMWVRNGLSLRHQMSTYRGVSQRDLAHHRDIFLLQTAMVVCNPNTVLASMIDRFSMDDWMRGNYAIRSGYEDTQLIDVAEDFIHLLIVLLSDRTSLQPLEDELHPQSLAMRRDISHILCFKPLSYSDLCSRLADKFQELEEFQVILEEMTNFRAPEGLSDSGTFELKPEYLADIDPYIAHYTKNQRDEAETAYRKWASKKTGKPISEIVFEPRLRPIKSGVFKGLNEFTRTCLFAQIIYYSLNYALDARNVTPNIPHTRVEAYLQVVLHLVLASLLEDHTNDEHFLESLPASFVHHLFHKTAMAPLPTIFSILQRLSTMDAFQACHAKLRLILRRLQQKRPRSYASATAAHGISVDTRGTDSPVGLPSEDLEMKKRQALDRQARVMAQFQQQQQNFLNSQGNIDWSDEDSDDGASIATGHTEEHKQIWKYPSGNCILCQEETNDARLFGTFALMMDSNILRQTDVEDSDLLKEVIATPPSLDRSADHMRPFGIASQNRGRIRKLDSHGNEKISERQGLGRGYPPSQTLRGPISTGCGHIMHYSCFELYYGATQRRQNHQIARNHPERMELKEFVCPLCKALGNTFLPIIWRGKEEMFPGPLQTGSSFEEWLQSNIGLTVSRLHKHVMGEEAKSAHSRHQELFVNYTSRTIIPPLANKLTQLMISEQSRPRSPQPPNRTPMPGLFPEDEGFSLTSPSHPLAQDNLAMVELVTIYNRIRDTIKVNRLDSRFHYPARMSGIMEDLTHTDTLGKAIGFSISAAEIAQRGVQSEPGSILLDKISPLTLTHLRILSETTSSYIAIGGLRNSGSNKTNQEFSEVHASQLLQLFAGHPQIYGSDDTPWARTASPVPAVLSLDSFIFLTECSIYLVPALNLDIHHIIRLCYLLELVKVTLSMCCTPTASELHPGATSELYNAQINPETLFAFEIFRERIRSFADPSNHAMTHGEIASSAFSRLPCKAVATYALPFLRKAAVLLHVRYGLDFPIAVQPDYDEPELERLTRTLRLPTLAEMFASAGRSSNERYPSILQSMVSGWINHYKWGYEQQHPKNVIQPTIRLSHPAIFELIGLPKHFDTLTDETMRRRCPTT